MHAYHYMDLITSLHYGGPFFFAAEEHFGKKGEEYISASIPLPFDSRGIGILTRPESFRPPRPQAPPPLPPGTCV